MRLTSPPRPGFQPSRKAANVQGTTQGSRRRDRSRIPAQSRGRAPPMITSSRLRLAVLGLGLVLPTAAFSLEAGTREVPAKEIPGPTAGVSAQEQSVIGAPLPAFWNDHPKDAAAWKALINMRAEAINKTLPGLREKFGVKSEQVTATSADGYILTPDSIPEQNRNLLLVLLHGPEAV